MLQRLRFQSADLRQGDTKVENFKGSAYEVTSRAISQSLIPRQAQITASLEQSEGKLKE